MIHYDSKGIPIYPGDLLRTFHYIGDRRKKYYLYHTVVNESGNLYMVPASHLEPTKVSGGGKCPLNVYFNTFASEIINGYGPEPYLCFDERPRRDKQ